MKIRTVAAFAVPLAACLTMNAQAAVPTKAPAPLTMTDAKGDSNFVNGEGIVTGGPNNVADGVSTPADVDATDITGVTIAATGSMVTRKVGKKTVKTFDCTGYTATLTLAGAPLTTGTLYRISAASTAWNVWYLEYNLEAGAKAETYLRYPDTSDPTGVGTKKVDLAPAKIEGSKITFTVTNKNIKAAEEKVNHVTLSNFGADVRVNAKVQNSGGTVPMYDQLLTDGSQSWKVCPA